ncbi:hypothetical protein E1281_09705 [Actinomadura sp. KC345]|uniref:hypothetical protein n=1 Tax=Actinomadura sp. KC345 TaxID=2530371 RepID=UPI00104883E2|nr:hypothetical protein [Actinomadura sp. KC345]TDC55965.1 hypothetical protein E1281_09705 [Actinomadura sp. KC345]
MTYLTGLLGLVAIAMMATLVLLAVRRDRAIRRNAPGAVAPPRPQGASLATRTEGGTTPPSAVR